jgi:hypothetical protein
LCSLQLQSSPTFARVADFQNRIVVAVDRYRSVASYRCDLGRGVIENNHIPNRHPIESTVTILATFASISVNGRWDVFNHSRNRVGVIDQAREVFFEPFSRVSVIILETHNPPTKMGRTEQPPAPNGIKKVFDLSLWDRRNVHVDHVIHLSQSDINASDQLARGFRCVCAPQRKRV